ncbi:hypothetical protein AMK59_8653 [Oryctes borbonicus]|uniref:Uncharacterized protein n=1 Tax=Oryctes borbonicus TaxID=1629725 RepID=A0A0T6AVQ7_9SCAR|nr:hypothetical protein AMK59_8653 [Oryctes borbonicus]
MLDVQKHRRRPSLENVKKYIGEFPDLYYDGAKIVCKVCDKPLFGWHKYDCIKHVNSIQHTNRKSGVPSREPFMLDLLSMFLQCGLQLRLLDKKPFNDFWNKYNSNWELPSRTTLRRYLPSLREDNEKNIKGVVKGKQLWLSVDETIDRKKNSIAHVMVRVLDPFQPNFPILLASKRIQKCTSEAITKVVLDTLQKFEVSPSQLLMFMSNGTAIMRCVGHSLKQECEQLLHVMCKAHTLHLVAQMIRKCYPEVDALISNTKKMFLKSPKRIRELHRWCPGIPEPPELSFTRWGSWLKAAFYYSKFFEQIKFVVLQFNPDEDTAIKESQIRFQDTSVETDLITIYDNYAGLFDAIEKFQNTGLSFVESVQIVNDVHTLLCATSEVKNMCIVEKFEEVINKDSDFTRLIQINDSASDPLSMYKDYFNYACLTSIDVKRSLSKYKKIFSSRRTQFNEANLETYLMLQTFQQSYSICAT